MIDSSRWIVVTTVQSPTAAMQAISRLCERGWSAVVIGDTKTPETWSCPNMTYLSVADQIKEFGSIANTIPVRHYCRKNLGYLYAIRRGANIILETDDDNFPEEGFGGSLQQEVIGESVAHQGWVNVYKYFTDALIWPRGLSLKSIHSVPVLQPLQSFNCPIQSYLADDDPDVDAIYRLIYKDPVRFKQRLPVVLGPEVWCPFNSQNTAFFAVAFPLLYLPCYVSIRMTDIWRSFVAQAVLVAHGYRVSFHPPTMRQVRNDHDLLKDFRDEMSGYLGNDEMIQVLSKEIERGHESTIAQTAHRMWRSLVDEKFVPIDELPVLDAWFAAVDSHRSVCA